MPQDSSKPKPVRVRVIKSVLAPVLGNKKIEPLNKRQDLIVPKTLQPKKEEPQKQNEVAKEFQKPQEKKKLLHIRRHAEKASRFISNNKIFLSVSVVLVVLIIGVTGFIVPQILYRSNIPGFLPKDTVAFGALSINPLNPEVRSLFNDLQTSSQNLDTASIVKEVDVASQDIFQNIDAKKAITQEVGFAVFNSDDGMSKALVLHVANPKDAQTMLENLLREQNLEQKSYKGSNIFIIRDKTDTTKVLSYLYSHEYVFIGTGATATFSIADVIHGDQPSLKIGDGYKRLVAASRSHALGRLYVDSSKISQLQGLVTLPSIILRSSTFLDNEPLYVSLYEKQGSLAYDLMYRRDYQKITELSGIPLSQKLPETTFATFEGKNFSQDWNDLKDVLTNSEPLLAFYFSNIQKRLQDSFQFNFESDFLKYFQDSYVVALDQTTSRSKNTGKPFQNIGIVLSLKSKDSFLEAEPDLEAKVKNILSSQFQNQSVNLSNEEYAGLTLKVFSGDGMPVNVYYVVHEGALYVSTSKTFFDNIKNTDQGSLADLSAFKKLSNIKDSNVLHVMYFNASKAGLDLVPESIQKIADGMLVRDSQKGDNAVITGYIHFLAKQ